MEGQLVLYSEATIDRGCRGRTPASRAIILLYCNPNAARLLAGNPPPNATGRNKTVDYSNAPRRCYPRGANVRGGIRMDIFLLQLIIVFTPGIIWERIDAVYGHNRSSQQWDILRRTFIFGLFSYVATFGLYWLSSFASADISFEVFKFQKDTTFIDAPAVREIVIASLVATVCAIVWLYLTNYKVITRMFQKTKATKRYGDEDVWDYTFNSPRAEVEYVHLRDFEKKITYAGWVELFSETEKLRELILRDVQVYDFEGGLLFETARVYVARERGNIDLEFPYRPEPSKTGGE